MVEDTVRLVKCVATTDQLIRGLPMTVPMNKLYRPTQEEHARQGFVGALKTYVNGELERDVVRRYHDELAPAFNAKHGHDATNRYEAIPVLEPDPDFQLWCSTVYSSQDLLWETTGETVDRLLPQFDQRAAGPKARAAPANRQYGNSPAAGGLFLSAVSSGLIRSSLVHGVGRNLSHCQRLWPDWRSL